MNFESSNRSIWEFYVIPGRFPRSLEAVPHRAEWWTAFASGFVLGPSPSSLQTSSHVPNLGSQHLGSDQLGVKLTCGPMLTQNCQVHPGWDRFSLGSESYPEHWAHDSDPFSSFPVYCCLLEGGDVQSCERALPHALHWWDLHRHEVCYSWRWWSGGNAAPEKAEERCAGQVRSLPIIRSMVPERLKLQPPTRRKSQHKRPPWGQDIGSCKKKWWRSGKLWRSEKWTRHFVHLVVSSN